MGSPSSEPQRSINEGLHEVSITRPFYLAAHEVTQGQYQTVMGKAPSHFTHHGRGNAYVKFISEDDLKRFPVESVTWEDAVAFCRKLSEWPEEKRLGRTYRLPTEAEWEYACRAGTSTPFHCGDRLSSSTEANFCGHYPYNGAAKGPYLSRTAAVGSYKPNAWGLYDMHGNVAEWCSDWCDDYYAAKSPKNDPRGPESGKERCVRGGSWGHIGRDCRSATRLRFEPNKGQNHVGFRVACTDRSTQPPRDR
jgi:formylglycine-generating enzyme required for sulfatase activity